MKQVFESVKSIEKSVSNLFSSDEKIAELLMIENAASELEKLVKKEFDKILKKKKIANSKKSVLIMCGQGNNGADGYTLARHLAGYSDINLLQVCEPKSFACQSSLKNLKPLLKNKINFFELKAEVKNTKLEKIINNSTIIVDCIFGTGFHDLVEEKFQNLFKVVNHSNALKIACDIPSGLEQNAKNIVGFSLQQKKHFIFCADITLTMGALKTTLFYDNAKDVVGKIKCASIGINKNNFLSNSKKIFEKNKIYLLEKSDLKLPIRKEQNTNKGSFGHAAIIAGEKLGAAILASCAAFKVGAGLSSIVFNQDQQVPNNFFQKFPYAEFKIPSSIMICKELANNVTSLVLGSGFGRENNSKIITDYFKIIKEKNLPIVLDADAFYYQETFSFLENLSAEEKNQSEKIQHKIILTPHPKEFIQILKRTGFGDFSVNDVMGCKIPLMKKFCDKYKNVVLVLKGSNTFICQKDKVYICDKGWPCLSKGGTGDVLAGIIAGLLAQKYNILDAAISGVLMHCRASKKFKNAYFLTPEDLIEKL